MTKALTFDDKVINVKIAIENVINDKPVLNKKNELISLKDKLSRTKSMVLKYSNSLPQEESAKFGNIVADYILTYNVINSKQKANLPMLIDAFKLDEPKDEETK